MTRALPGPVLLLHLHLLLLLLHAVPVQPGPPPTRYFGQIPENSPSGTPVDGVLVPVGAGGWHVHVRRMRMMRMRRRRPRALTQELTYTVTVPDHGGVGDLVFTVPDQRFEQRWFEVEEEEEEEEDSPVQIERDSGRLYLARGLLEPTEVLVKIHDGRGLHWI